MGTVMVAKDPGNSRHGNTTVRLHFMSAVDGNRHIDRENEREKEREGQLPKTIKLLLLNSWISVSDI